jgi:hypothetical protein
MMKPHVQGFRGERVWYLEVDQNCEE